MGALFCSLVTSKTTLVSGWLSSTTVKVAIVPSSLVFPEIAEAVKLASSSSSLVTDTVWLVSASNALSLPDALTANVMQGIEDTCRDAGMDDYVSKPVKKENLRRALVKHGPS